MVLQMLVLRVAVRPVSLGAAPQNCLAAVGELKANVARLTAHLPFDPLALKADLSLVLTSTKSILECLDADHPENPGAFGVEDDEAKDHEGNMSAVICCCKQGRCSKDEQGAAGTRALETSNLQCCRQVYSSHNSHATCPAAFSHEPNSETCIAKEQEDIDRVIALAQPASIASAQKCTAELRGMQTGLQNWASTASFHGHWIREIHVRHFAESLFHQLLVLGTPAGPGSVFARLFTTTFQTKFLWTGLIRES